jgi:DNA-directed RNA polymerase subunit RPC12/RpoP
MYIDHTPHLRDRWAAKDPVKREFRCVRCGKRWQAAAGWLPAMRECEECRSKTSSPDPARSSRGWIA